MNSIKNKQAFTLIQLIVTVSVVLVLSATVLFGTDAISRKGAAKDIQRWTDVTALAKAVELYQVDNHLLPPDFRNLSINEGDKYIICSLGASRTCDGQAKTCKLIDDIDFLDNYLGGALPIDPEKSATTDTGYYVGRSGDKMLFGACESYDDNLNIEYTVSASLEFVCGNGIIEGSEVCDDGDNVTEGCGNGALDTAGTYCNSDCTATVTAINEVCDYNDWTVDCSSGGTDWTKDDTTGTKQSCNQACTVIGFACGDGGIG